MKIDRKLKELNRQVEIAFKNYDEAANNYIDIALYELMAAEIKLNDYLRERRLDKNVG